MKACDFKMNEETMIKELVMRTSRVKSITITNHYDTECCVAQNRIIISSWPPPPLEQIISSPTHIYDCRYHHNLGSFARTTVASMVRHSVHDNVMGSYELETPKLNFTS